MGAYPNVIDIMHVLPQKSSVDYRLSDYFTTYKTSYMFCHLYCTFVLEAFGLRFSGIIQNLIFVSFSDIKIKWSFLILLSICSLCMALHIPVRRMCIKWCGRTHTFDFHISLSFLPFSIDVEEVKNLIFYISLSFLLFMALPSTKIST